MKPIVVEAHYEAAPERVWTALTSQPEMVQWFFEQIEEFHPEPGFQTTFSVYSGEREFRHYWEVTEAVPGKKLSFEWIYPDYGDDSRVTFELETEEGGTQLRLLCWGIENYPQDIPEFTRESCINGWEWFLNERLRQYLAKTTNG